MNDQSNPNDWEALSAYLDGQLSTREQNRLEKRLRSDKVLNTALLDLQKVKTLLRSQPMIKAPRNFMLTPEMVGQKTASKPKINIFGSLRMASILTTILFMVVFLGDLLFRFYQPMTMMVAQAPAEEIDMLAIETREGIGAGNGDESEQVFEAPEALMPAEPEMEAEAELATETDISSMAESEAEEQDQKGEEKKPRANATIFPTEVADLVSEYPLTEDRDDLEFPPKEISHPSDSSYPIREATWGFLDWVKLILGLIALSTGMVYFLLKRRKPPK
jgi:hypothetical protein